MEKLQLKTDEMLEALQRSGYLLESEIAKALRGMGMVTECNQVILDKFTGKSREIDIIAEEPFFRSESMSRKCASKVKFIFEIKNNTAPLMLLSEFTHSPNIADWEGIKSYITLPDGFNDDVFIPTYWDHLFMRKQQAVYSQYCSFQVKKGTNELMAVHPDFLESGFAKITQLCEEYAEPDAGRWADDIWRDFAFIPVLLIQDDLYVVNQYANNNHKIKKVSSSILVYNYHYKDKPAMAYVFVVTRKGLKTFVNSMLKTERLVETEMLQSRKIAEQSAT